VKHRAAAQALVEEGHVRLNKVRVVKCSCAVKPDDVLTIALPGRVKVVRVRGEAERRGSASLAQALYDDLTLPAVPEAHEAQATSPESHA